MADLSAVWFAGLLGKIKQDGEDVELGGGLNFITPVVATFNSATKMVDVALDGSEEVSFTIVQSDGIDKPTRQKLNFLGFNVVDDVGNNAVKVGLGTPAQTGHILTWNAATGKWDAGRALTGNYTVTGELLAGTLTAAVKVDAPIVDTNALQGGGADITIDDDLVFSDGKGISISSGTPKSAVFGSGNALAFGADGWSIVSYISDGYHMFSDGPLLGDVYAWLHPTDGLYLDGLPITGASAVILGNGAGYYCDSSPAGTPVRIAAVNATEDIFLGDATNGTSLTAQVKADGAFMWTIGVNTELALSATTADFQNNNIVTTGYYQTGGASAALAGAYRSATGDVLMAGTTSVRAVHVDGSGNAFYGDSDSVTGTRAASAILGAATNVQVRVGGTTRVLFDATTADFQDNNVVTTGSVILGNASVVTFDSSPGGTPFTALAADSSENLYVGSFGANGCTAVIYGAKAGGAHALRVDNIDQFVLSATTADFQNNNVVTTGYYQQGSTPASTGTSFRLSAQAGVYVRNQGNTADLRLLEHGADDRIYIGDHTNTVDIIVRAAGSFVFQQGATPTTRLSIGATNADFTTLNIVTTGYYSAGSSPAGLGYYRLPLNGQIAGKNDVTAADMLMLAGYTGGHVQLGSSGGNGASLVSVDVRSGGTFDVYNNGAPVQRTGASTFGVLAAAASPGTPQTYAASNVTTDRTYDANATTLDEIADVLGTLIADLRAFGFVV